MSVLLYGCTTKPMAKKLDSNCTTMLWAVLNKSWRQHPTMPQLYRHLPLISKTIQIRWARHCWRSKGKLISDVLLWTPLQEGARVGRPARTHPQKLCTYTRCSMEDLLRVMDNRDEWQDRIREIHASNMPWWWWWYIYIHISTDIILVFVDVPGDWGSNSHSVIPKTQKMVLDASLLTTQHYMLWIKRKWSKPGKAVVPSPTSQCFSYWKGSLRVTLDYGWPTYLSYI